MRHSAITGPVGRWTLLNLAAHGILILALGLRLPPGTWLLGLLGPVFSIALWGPWILEPLSRKPWRLRLFWGLWCVWLVVALGHRHYLGIYPDHGAIEFSLSEPFYAWTLLKDRFTIWILLAMLLAGSLGFWLSSFRPSGFVRRSWRWKGLLLSILVLVGIDKLDLDARAMGPEATSLLMLTQTRPRRIGQGGLRRALARELPPKGPPPGFHVLFLVHESLTPDCFDPELSPGLGRAIADGEVLPYARAFAPATMTDVAVPALFSGVNPAQPSRLFHRVPLLWHQAQARGMATGLFSAQRYNYYGFPDYLLADGLDRWESADHAGLPLSNDTGCDDEALVVWHRDWLRSQLREGRTTFTVLHFNATHAPYLQKEGFTPWTPEAVAKRRPELPPAVRTTVARYWNAIRYLDDVQGRILETLRAEGILDRTWILATSDHGEVFSEVGRGRMDDYRPTALHVPLWMRLPTAFPQAWRAGLTANRDRLVQTLDLAPTLAEGLGSGSAVFPGSLGASLLHPLPQGRRVLAHNSGEIRKREPEVISVIWEEGGDLRQWRWHSREGQVFELVVPGGSRPFEPSAVQKSDLRRTLDAFPILSRLVPQGP